MTLAHIVEGLDAGHLDEIPDARLDALSTRRELAFFVATHIGKYPELLVEP